MSAPSFSHDWFSGNIKYWEPLLEGLRGNPNLHFLEIGCFEGRATRWLLENILTDKTSKISVIDTFAGSPEHGSDVTEGLKKRFCKNIEPYADQVIIYTGKSSEILMYSDPEQENFRENRFDFIYIDGSHLAADVLSDAVLSFPLLKKNGIMVFDDYMWRPYSEEWKMPRVAINAFLECYQPHLQQLHIGYQCFIKKL